jgi:hypothetical protein
LLSHVFVYMRTGFFIGCLFEYFHRFNEDRGCLHEDGARFLWTGVVYVVLLYEDGFVYMKTGLLY